MMDGTRRIEVHGSTMAYVESGEGDPIVFLHGNPTSSYIWRNIVPHVRELGRCIAPDLIGMGDSDKLEPSGPGTYRFVVHRRYLDALLDALGVSDNVVLVGQDWGSALAFDWANRHREQVKGIAHMEAIVRPWSREQWPMTPDLLPVFLAMRSDAGEEMILEQNVFVEGTVPQGTMRRLTDPEMNEYRRPFLEPGEGRRPTLDWPREIPFEGVPADVDEIVSSYGKWLRTAPVAKLFIDVDPGFIVDDATRAFIRNWPNQEEITVRGLHFAQEDAPVEIGQGLARWYAGINAG